MVARRYEFYVRDSSCHENINETFFELTCNVLFTEDCWRRPKKIRRCFDHTPTHFSVVEGTREKCYQT